MAYDTEGRLALDANDFIASANNAADASEDLGKSTDNASESLFEFDSAGAAASGAAIAVGQGMQKALDNSRDWRESLDRTASSMDITEDQANDLAKSMSNETFDLTDVTQTMDNFAKIGVDTREEMEELATASDAIADATGTTASSVSENLAPVVRALDGDLDAIVDSQDAFTLAARESGTSVEELSSTVSRLDFGQLQDMGLKTEEVTGLVSEFSQESGYTGRQLESNFNQAVRASEGDLDSLLTELDLGPNALENWDTKLQENQGITEEHAASVADQASTMDVLRSRFDDVMLSAGSLLQPFSALAPALTALGTAGMAMSTINFSAVIPSLAGVQASLVGLMPVILPLIAIVGTLALAWKTDFLGIQGIVENVIGTLRNVITAFVGDLREWWESSGQDILASVTSAFNRIEQAILTTLNFIRSTVITPFVAWLESLWAAHGEQLVAEFRTTWKSIREDVNAAITFIQENVIRPFVEFVEPFVTAFLDRISTFWSNHGEKIMTIVRNLWSLVEAIFSTAFANLTEIISAFLSLARGDFDGFATNITNIFRNTWDLIKTIFSTAFENLKIMVSLFVDAIVGAFRSLANTIVGNSIIPDMFDDIEGVFAGFLEWVSSVWDLVGNVSQVFTDAKDDALEVIDDLVSTVTTKLDDLVDDILGFGGDAADEFAKGFNQAVPSRVSLPSRTISAPDWAGGMSKTIGGGGLDLPQLDTGAYVESDGPAMLHAGERVLPSAQVNDRGEAEFDGVDEDVLARAMKRVDRTDDVVSALERVANLVSELGTGDVSQKDILRALEVADDRHSGRDPLA